MANELRRRRFQNRTTYVINHNINFTNACIKRCSFCAFSRTRRNQEAHYLPLDEVVRRARQAHQFGATEVCIQAGLPAGMRGDLYLRICQAIKAAAPELHIHAFSPEEILYGASRSQRNIHDYLTSLKESGLDSLPGTSAEILDDEIRDQISLGRITPRQWVEIISTAHRLGLPTTSTIMYGHAEPPGHCARHLPLLRDLQP